MSYFTGTANAPSDLKALIETKAVLAGWTLSGTGWLYKGGSFVKLTATDGGATPSLEITGSNSSDGLTEPAGFSKGIYITSSAWPVTYYLFLNNTPDEIVLVTKYSTNKIQTIQFGDIVKIASAAYVGGNYFFGSRTATGAEKNGLNAIQLHNLYCNTCSNGSVYNGNQVIPFGKGVNPAGQLRETTYNNGIHAKIDGRVWDTAGIPSRVTYTDSTISALYRSPNTYNSQSHLVPMNLQFAMADSLYGYLGYIGHTRFIRIDNYEIGDIIDLAPDYWKVFPWYIKDTINRNGGYPSELGISGTIGFAVRYTP